MVAVIYLRPMEVKRVPEKKTWQEKVAEYLVIGLVLAVAIWALGGCYKAWSRLSSGKTARTSMSCLAAVDMDALEKYESAAKIKDTFGMTELVNGNRVFPLEPMRPLLVLESTPNWREMIHGFWWRRRVRILDGPYEGKAAWLADRFMVPWRLAPPTPAP
jgi:hypothetical protein